ncbi:anoctamin family protein [Aspergillus aculeatinus CBS 121060]|uniref:Plasma membrane stress response protein n=1 Tax=Aspergillus aculeatinus CBS 121060 TaxID=1448322 RepID=A0ACD1H650_9EURO|nr:plasma membrane stress response protein [Aspergillus aculeatinus CBS 121060]RAH69068.1 plasma membrane stress response protein [Aspergillus aculeatinus CBS 121060]
MGLFAGHEPVDQAELDNFGVDWVIHYSFEDLEISQAISEFRTLIHDLEEAHLQVQVRHGYGPSLLVFIRVPPDLLGNMVYKSRVKDWLHGIIHEFPAGDDHTVVESETAAEALRSVYHAVTWQKHLGGAGITPKIGQWKNIQAAIPLQDRAANAELLRKWSKTLNITAEDLDAIRALFGEKVAFYFAFIHCYSTFLVFPAVWGVFCWFYLGPYSITCALVNCLWCIIFVEYWKTREIDLSLRWNVRDVGILKVNRPEWVWDKEVQNPVTGETVKVFSTQKQFLRQLLLIPFATVAALALGTLIILSFASEVLVSEIYTGPFKGYLEFLPTILFSLSLPWITNTLTEFAKQLTDYENYRTQDQYDVAQTSKTFVMHFITAFLPTLLTAFVYVPFGTKLVPYLDVFRTYGLMSANLAKEIHIDPARLQQEVIYLSATAQLLNFGEEIVLPYVKQTLMHKWRTYRDGRDAARMPRRHSQRTDLLLVDAPEEAAFLARVRDEVEADEYNVHDDTLEMCVQFGYLALFGVAWPLVPLGFLANNWLELRGDFFKLSLECQRPPPIRADSIGPSLQGLEVLAWLGTLSTAAVVYLYRNSMEGVQFSSFLLTLLLAEWAYLGVRFVVQTGMERISSVTLKRAEAKRYGMRKRYLEATSGNVSPRGKPRVRFEDKVSVYTTGTDVSTSKEGLLQPGHDGLHHGRQFWSWAPQEAADAGVRMIKALNTTMDGSRTGPTKLAKGA